jgi:hypothetical protein
MSLGSPNDAGGSIVEVTVLVARVQAGRGLAANISSTGAKTGRVRPIRATPVRTQPTSGGWPVTLHGAR